MATVYPVLISIKCINKTDNFIAGINIPRGRWVKSHDKRLHLNQHAAR